MSAAEKTAVITGVSTGIGRASAKALIDVGWRVFGSVRKEKDAADVQAALGERLTPLVFDVTDAQGVAAAATNVDKALGGRTLGGLVNNAGIALGGPVAHLPLDVLDRQLDVNLYGPIRVIQAFLPMLGTDKRFEGPPGRIVNMSSIAGKIASPFMSPYAMSKHALEALSDSLRRELLMYGIDVVTIGPGAVRTPIWAKADEIDVTPYEKTAYEPFLRRMLDGMKAYGEGGVEPSAVGELVRTALTARTPKTRYAILNNELMFWTLPRMLPKRMVDRALAKRFGVPTRRG